MTRSRPEKKRGPQAADDTKILPMELRVSAIVVHARVQRINEPASWEIRNWDAFKRISVEGRPPM